MGTQPPRYGAGGHTPPGVDQQPGEFTRMLQPPAARPGPKIAPPKTQGPYEVGEFTRLMETPSGGLTSPKPPAGTPRISGGGDATQAFSAPAPPPPPMAAPVDAPPAGPSEYTMLFKGPAKAPPPQEPAAPKPKNARPLPPVRKKPTNVLLIVAVSLGVLVVIAIIAYLVMRH